MRFLADENFPRTAVMAIEAAGHDIIWVRVGCAGRNRHGDSRRDDTRPADIAHFRQDFGELAAQAELPAGCGIVLLRLPMADIEDVGTALARRALSRDDWAGHFSVIEPGRVRMRPIR